MIRKSSRFYSGSSYHQLPRIKLIRSPLPRPTPRYWRATASIGLIGWTAVSRADSDYMSDPYYSPSAIASRQKKSREREDERSYSQEYDWFPDRYRDEPEFHGDPEYPFHDFNYGP